MEMMKDLANYMLDLFWKSENIDKIVIVYVDGF